MTAARWHDQEYDLANFTEDGHYVLRDPQGDVTLTDGVELDRQTVEVRCDICGAWTRDHVPVGPPGHGLWVCAVQECYVIAGERFGDPRQEAGR